MSRAQKLFSFPWGPRSINSTVSIIFHRMVFFLKNHFFPACDQSQNLGSCSAWDDPIVAQSPQKRQACMPYHCGYLLVFHLLLPRNLQTFVCGVSSILCCKAKISLSVKEGTALPPCSAHMERAGANQLPKKPFSPCNCKLRIWLIVALTRPGWYVKQQ